LKLFGLFLFYVVPVRKKTAISNIRNSLKVSISEAKKIAKKAYMNFFKGIFEIINLEKLDKVRISKIAEFNNFFLLEDAIKKGRGVIFCTIHLGGFYFIGYALKRVGITVNYILKKQRNLKVFEILKKRFLDIGIKYTVLQKVPKNIFRALNSGDVVIFQCDQDAGKTGVFVDFFGRPASTPQGPALFHKSLKVPIILAYCVYENKKYKINCKLYDNPEKEVEEIVFDYTKFFEDVIRKYPDQYFWLHKRWHTKKCQN